MIGVDDSFLDIVGIGVLNNEEGAAVLDLVVFKAAFVLLVELNVLVEEADVVLGEVFVLVIVFFFDEAAFQLPSAQPREELHLEASACKDLILENELNLLHHPLAVCAHVQRF